MIVAIALGVIREHRVYISAKPTSAFFFNTNIFTITTFTGIPGNIGNLGCFGEYRLILGIFSRVSFGGIAARSAMITVSYDSDSGFPNDIGGIGGVCFVSIWYHYVYCHLKSIVSMCL